MKVKELKEILADVDDDVEVGMIYEGVCFADIPMNQGFTPFLSEAREVEGEEWLIKERVEEAQIEELTTEFEDSVKSQTVLLIGELD